MVTTLRMIPWPKYLVELFGTFFWTLFLGMALSSGSPLWPIGVGLGLMALIYAGHVHSGAHYNPAYTVAVLIMRRISWRDGGFYLLAQVLGAIGGAGMVLLLSQDDAFQFQLVPPGSANLVQVLSMELVLSFGLVWVGLTALLSKRYSGHSYQGLAVAAAYLAALITGWEVSRAVLNPALALGANLLSGAYIAIWPYWVASLLGGALAGLLFRGLSPEELGPSAKLVQDIRDEVLATMEEAEVDEDEMEWEEEEDEEIDNQPENTT